VLNIRIFAGGPLAKSARPERLAVLTSGTDLDNEVRCAAAVRAALASEASGQRGHSEVRAPDACGTPAQAALRFALGNKEFATRVIGITTIAQFEEALAVLAQGPLPAAAMSSLDALWRMGLGLVDAMGDMHYSA